MAAEGEVPERMVREHQSGYDGFVSLMKWGTAISLVTALFVILLIA